MIFSVFLCRKSENNVWNIFEWFCTCEETTNKQKILVKKHNLIITQSMLSLGKRMKIVCCCCLFSLLNFVRQTIGKEFTKSPGGLWRIWLLFYVNIVWKNIIYWLLIGAWEAYAEEFCFYSKLIEEFRKLYGILRLPRIDWPWVIVC